MRRLGSVGAGACLAAGSLLVPGCGWDELNAITTQASIGNGPPDGGGSGDGAADDAPPEASAGSDADNATACSTAIVPARQWTFDTDPQGWSLFMNAGVLGTLSWTATTGNPSPGAVEVDVTGTPMDGGQATGAWAEYLATPLGDLSGRTISAWLWLDSDDGPAAKLFVQTGSQFTWADNGAFRLVPRTWTCVSMSMASPAYTNGPDYDPTNVVRLGFELDGTSTFRLFIDTVRYY